MPRCSRQGCTEEAEFRPVLLLVMAGSVLGHRIRLDIQVCEAHRRALRQSFSGVHGQVLVEQALKDRKRGTPDWARSRLYFERVH
ncbi:MAG TPA: hypothetical protein VF904_02300 [Anaeromyxobacteraceae bacterium]